MLLEWEIENKLFCIVIDDCNELTYFKKRGDYESFPRCHFDECSIFQYLANKLLPRNTNKLLPRNTCDQLLWSIKISPENNYFRSIIEGAINSLGREVDVDQLIEGKWLYDLDTPGREINFIYQLKNFLHLQETFYRHFIFTNLTGEECDIMREFFLSFEDLSKYCKGKTTTNTLFFFSISIWKFYNKLKDIHEDDLDFFTPSYENQWYSSEWKR